MTIWYGITWAFTECILTEALAWACLQMAEWAKTKCSVHSLSRCSGVCIAQYMPKGFYQPVYSHGVVLADTNPKSCIGEYTLLWEKRNLSVLNWPLWAFTVLACTGLYCTGLYCTGTYCTGLFWSILYWPLWAFTLVACTGLYCTGLYCTGLYCTGTYCTGLFWSVLYWPVLVCTVLASIGLYHNVAWGTPSRGCILSCIPSQVIIQTVLQL